MNIEFIKWMVGYAKGFELCAGPVIGDEVVILPDGVSSMTTADLPDRKILYPLLLQRAIEGINDDIKHEWIIIADGNNIEVHDIKGLVDGWAYTDIDEAKEQSLKYIYEQVRVND